MAITALATFPAQPQFTEEVALGDVRVRIQFTWRERMQAWYVDLFDVDENALIRGQRLSEGWIPLEGYAIPGLDRETLIVVQGPSPYVREDLGARLMVLVVPKDELPVTADPDDVTISVA